MDLEIFILIEQSQTEKHKYHMILLTCGFLQNGTNEPICRTTVETLTWRTNSRAQLGGEGVGSRYGESNMEMCIAICKIDSQCKFAV